MVIAIIVNHPELYVLSELFINIPFNATNTSEMDISKYK
jgi:hypothetical protein